MSTTDNNQNHVTFSFDYVTDERIEVQLPTDSPITQALLEHDARWKKTNRADTRRDRHSSPSEFPKEGMHFAADIDIERDLINKQAVATAFAGLSERQRFLIEAVVLDGYSFAEIARAEHKDESAIRHAYNRAIKRARKILEADRPESSFGVAYRAKQQKQVK